MRYERSKTPMHELNRYLEKTGRLIVTWPNALSPFGWLYFVFSRFTTPSTPRTPMFIRRVAKDKDGGLQISSLLYAFPSWAPLGHTMVAEMRRSS